MEFSEFAGRLHAIIGAGSSTVAFTKSIIEAILSDEGQAIIGEYGDDTYKAYFNGNTKITRLAKKVTAYIEPFNFSAYIDEFPDATHDSLVDSFSDALPDATSHDIGEQLAKLFESILKVAAMSKRKIPKKAEPEISSSDDQQEIIDNISDALLMFAKAADATVHDAAEKSMQNKKKTGSPEDEPAVKLTFYDEELNSNDSVLLQNFCNDCEPTMIYIIEHDPAGSATKVSLLDEIEDIIRVWKYAVRKVENATLRKTMLNIIQTLGAYTEYLSDLYLRYIPDVDVLYFRNESFEEGERLREVLRPKTYELRKQTAELYRKLFPIPEDDEITAEVVDDEQPSGAADTDEEPIQAEVVSDPDVKVQIINNPTIVNQNGEKNIHIEHLDVLNL